VASFVAPSEVLAVVDEAKLKTLFGIEDGGSFPTVKLQAFIDGIELTMKSELGGVYKLPITGAQSLEILKGISLCINAEALYSFHSDGTIPDRIKEMGERGRALMKQYCGDQLVKDGKPTKYLPDATTQGTVSMKTPDAMSYKGT
jgi:hypothetical protein